MFFKPAMVKQTSTSVDSSQSSSTQSSSTQSSNDKETMTKQSTLGLVVRNSETIKAEVIWVMKCVASGYSNNSRRDLQKIFSTMFTDSNAKSITVGANKMRYGMNFGIAPVFKSILMEPVKKVEVFVALFDESLNEQTQNCEMDILTRYFDDIENMVKVRYLTSNFMGHSTRTDLYLEFSSALKEFDGIKLLQISMAGPNVNLKFLNDIDCTKDRVGNEQHELIFIGTCGLHVTHGAFKTGAESTDWKLKKVIKAAFQILHDSPARCEDYKSIPGCVFTPTELLCN